MMVGCVEGILGLRPDINGLRLSPSIPTEWNHLEIDKDFRNKHLHIIIENPDKKENGCSRLLLNGKEMQDSYLPFDLLEQENEIIYTL